MERIYLDYLFLDLFSTQETRKLSSLFHIMTGKRTISVLLQAMRMELGGYYALFPKLNYTHFEKRINAFIDAGLLSFDYKLTSMGGNQVEAYFDSHTSISCHDRLRFFNVLGLFKSRSLFLSQILSEKIHENKNYLPIQSRLIEQVWAKRFLRDQRLTEVGKCKEIGEEWLSLLTDADIEHPEVFVEQFEGFGKSKLTLNQIAAKYGRDEIEIYVQLEQDWVRLLEMLAEKDLPILSAVLMELMHESGLASDSARETYRLWQTGRSVEAIGAERNLKPSTVYDHLTEIAILDAAFPFESFLSPEQMQYIAEVVEKGQSVDYVQVQNEFAGIPFFQSRLMQVKGEHLHDRG